MTNTQHDQDTKLGWTRIKSLFEAGPGQPRPEAMKYFKLTVFVATCMGFLYGGKVGARQAKEKFMAMNHNTKFAHPIQAQRGIRDAGFLGYIKQGSKWGWKLGLFAGVFSGASSLLTLWRGKEDGLNLIAAGGITGGLYRMKMGVMPAIGGAVLGLWISFPLGVVMYGAEKLFVRKKEEKREDIMEKEKEEELLEAHQAKEIEWKQKLNATTAIIDEMENESCVEDLEEYYNLPSNSENCTDKMGGGPTRW